MREVRQILQGTQCPACLRHFASHFRLCNHVERTPRCLAFAARCNDGASVEPGRGSRKFDTGNDVILPAVAASGPRRFVAHDHYVPESRRPDADLILALEELFAQDPAEWSYPAVLAEAKRVFASKCLQHSRLRATAEAWQAAVREELDGNDEVDREWAAQHTRLADFLTSVDFADWLVPEATPTVKEHATFRDAATLLPWISLTSLTVAAVGLPSSPSLTLVLDGYRVDCAGQPECPLHLVSFDDCFRSPAVLDFLRNTPVPCNSVFGFLVGNLLPSTSFPRPIKNYRSLEPHLHRLRLFADLVRGVFHLWTCGVCAFIVVEGVSCPGLAAVRAAAPHTSQWQGQTTLSNFVAPQVLLTRFTFPAPN